MIVDASVAFKWIFVEDGGDAAAALFGRNDLRAPALLLAEIGNALWKKSVRGELGDQATYSAQLSLVGSLVTTIAETEFVARALQIAVDLNHPIYDCIYLAMAERENDHLCTADVRFARKIADTIYAPLVMVLA